MNHLLRRLAAMVLLTGLLLPVMGQAQDTEPPVRSLLLDFTADMNDVINDGTFNPETDALYLTGDLTGWSSDELDLGSFQFTANPDVIGFFNLLVEVQIPDVPEDQVLDFKMLFVNGLGETVWEADPTQSYVVSPTTTVIGDAEIITFTPDFTYGERLVTFVVDMSAAIEQGVLQPENGDFVTIASSMNDWSTLDAMIAIDGTPDFYETTLSIRGPESADMQYKFRILAADGRLLPNGGWELLTNELGEEVNELNRVFTLGPRDVDMVLPDAVFGLPANLEVFPEISTIADARLQGFGEPASVRGVLTIPSIANSSEFADFYIADESGGIRVFVAPQFMDNIPTPDMLTPGVAVEVYGVRGEYFGDQQINAQQIVISDIVPEPVAPAVIADYVTDWSMDSPFMGAPIVIENVSLLDAVQWPFEYPGTGVDVTLVDELGQEYNLRISGPGNGLMGPLPDEWKDWSIKGIMGSFNGTPQIFSYYLEDITPTSFTNDVLINGNFDSGDLAPWTTFIDEVGGVSATVGVVDGEVAVTEINSPNSQGWQVQLNQVLTQEQMDQLLVGAIYTVRFDARSSEEGRPLFYYFGEEGGSYIEEGSGLASLSTTMQTYEFEFKLRDLHPQMKLGFELGESNADVVLDNVFMFVKNPEALAEVSLPVTFDDPDVNYGIVDFGGNVSALVEDPFNPDNTVVESIKTGGALEWAGTSIGGDAGFLQPLPLGPDDTILSVRVLSPFQGIPVLLKAENSRDPSVFVETRTFTATAGEWHTMEFDFANTFGESPMLDPDQIYDRLSIFFNFGTDGAALGDDLFFYWDDVFAGPVQGEGQREINFRVDVFDITEQGIFNPDADEIYVKGSFNDWSTFEPMTRSGDFEFEQSWLVDGPEGSFIEYKYFIVDANGNEMPNDGWEMFSDPITGQPSSFLNRFLQLGPDGANISLMEFYTLQGDFFVPDTFLPVTLVSSSDGILQGEGLSIDVLVGSPEVIAENLYGVGMTLFYDSEVFTFDSIERGEMLAGYEDVLLEFLDVTSSSVEIFFSFTLTDDQLSLPGFGQLATLNFTTTSDAPAGLYFFSTSAEEAIDNAGGFFDISGDFIFVDILGPGMYPGDTNRDGIVDAFDVEPISAWFLEMGPARPVRSIQWTRQEFFTWDFEEATFADANGDGIVNQNDLLPIGLNFGKTTPDYAVPMKIAQEEAAPVAFTLPAMQPGDVVRFQVDLGTENYPITEVRSMAMNLGFDAASLTLSSVEAGEWTADAALLQFNRYDADRGLQSLSLARTDAAATVTGNAMVLTFEAQDVIAEGTPVTLEGAQITHDEGVYFWPRMRFSDINVTSAPVSELPVALELSQNFPNPFNPTTRINFSLPQEQQVTLEVYTVMGQRVAALASGRMAAGMHSVTFNAAGLSSGMYLYRLTTESGSLSRTMMLIK